MKKFLGIVLLIGLAGCHPHQPQQPPQQITIQQQGGSTGSVAPYAPSRNTNVVIGGGHVRPPYAPYYRPYPPRPLPPPPPRRGPYPAPRAGGVNVRAGGTNVGVRTRR